LANIEYIGHGTITQLLLIVVVVVVVLQYLVIVHVLISYTVYVYGQCRSAGGLEFQTKIISQIANFWWKYYLGSPKICPHNETILDFWSQCCYCSVVE
jgi:hypothetical protein